MASLESPVPVNREKNSLSQLPLVLLLDIGKQSLEMWRALVFSVPKVGRWSLDKDYQKQIQRHFTRCITSIALDGSTIKRYKVGKKLNTAYL